uniref:Uncharacterized protein n=1 Tax=Oryza meridionalis TaxID=40149 RepID=A0A0E0E2B6_9ORYZ
MAGERRSFTGWSPAAGGAAAHFFLPAAVIVVVLHQLAVWSPPSPHTTADGRRLRLGHPGQAHPDGPRGLDKFRAAMALVKSDIGDNITGSYLNGIADGDFDTIRVLLF